MLSAVPTPRRRFWIGVAILVAISMATVLPLCGQMFQCGCTLLHGEHLCNIHHHLGPHCPWCEGGVKAMLPGYGMAMGCGILILRFTARRSIWLGVLCGAAVYLLITCLVGLATVKLMHYPTWFGWQIQRF